MTTTKELTGTSATFLSTSELGGLTNNAATASAALAGTGVYNNTAGSGSSSTTGDGYERVYLTYNPGGSMSGAASVNSSLDVYFLKSTDGGSTYESTTSVPTRAPDAVLPFNPSSSSAANNKVTVLCLMPGLNFKILALNNNSGQTIPTSSTLTALPATDSQV